MVCALSRHLHSETCCWPSLLDTYDKFRTPTTSSAHIISPIPCEMEIIGQPTIRGNTGSIEAGAGAGTGAPRVETQIK